MIAVTESSFRIEFGEKVGSGIKRMKKICRDEKAPVPKIELRENYFYVTFKPNPEYLKMASEKVGEKDLEKLTKNQRKIIFVIKKNQRITQKELSNIVGINEKNIRNVRNFPPVCNWWLKAFVFGSEKFLSMLKNHLDS